MPEVFFFTNRQVTGPAENPASYGASPAFKMTTGIAQVSPADLTTLTDGAITGLEELSKETLSPAAAVRLKAADNIIVFVHGFANSFPDSVLRAAFNLEWFTSFGTLQGRTAVVLFSWPSSGKTVEFGPVLVSLTLLPLIAIGSGLEGHLTAPAAQFYRDDQRQARDSADEFLSALDGVGFAMEAVRRRGGRLVLLVHSLGHEVIAQAMSRPSSPGGMLFHEAVLAAADTAAVRDRPLLPWVGQLAQVAQRVHFYTHSSDRVLHISAAVNFRERVGQRGAVGMPSPGQGTLRWVDCSVFTEAGTNWEQVGRHWYYRRIKPVGADIAAAMVGQGLPGRNVFS